MQMPCTSGMKGIVVMSTHDRNSQTRTRAARARAALYALPGVLLAAVLLFLLTASPVFAYPAHALADQRPPENLARIGPSLVRLLVSYQSLSPQHSDLECTGLGVIIASGTATTTSTTSSTPDENNFVLTDGALVDPKQATCAQSSRLAVRLVSIQIFVSSAYDATQPAASFSALPPSDPVVQCQQPSCSNGLALVAFHSESPQTLPYADLATGDSSHNDAIELTQSPTSQIVPPSAAISANQIRSYSQAITQALTPVVATGPNFEPGVPSVNAVGEVTGLHLTSGTPTSAAAITNFLADKLDRKVFFADHPNPVHDNWVKGLQALYGTPSNTQEANSAFQSVLKANPQFTGAKTFIQLSSLSSSPGEPGRKPPTSNNSAGKEGLQQVLSTLQHFVNQVPLLVWFILGIMVLLLLIFLTTRLFKRATHKREVEDEWKEAERISSGQLAAMQQQPSQSRRSLLADKPTLVPPYAPGSPAAQDAPTLPMGSAAASGARLELPCPNCGYVVARDAPTCPNCHVLLSPSDSGYHLRAQPPAFPVSMSPIKPSTPTIDSQPTLEYSPGTIGNGAHAPSQGDKDKTVPSLTRQAPDPYSMASYPARSNRGKQANGGFEVVPRTNRGIKRKHKANEDSVFAAQGTCSVNGTRQEVGVFVVADGMGGHANGQDASRLAIQAIKEEILPRLQNGFELTKDNLKQLLVGGVKKANQAIHQRNMEQHADMGTTMTAALVVGMPITETGPDGKPVTYPAVACVTNVGDSRTYLYREPEGLKKLTQDHSVVASLVAAGIIQEDDIYTHPRRNQIYRSLGEKPDVEVDAFIEPLRLGDRLLLCSDGLWDMVRDPRIQEVMRANLGDLNKMGDALIQAALDGGGEDNVSIIAVHLPEDGIKPSPHPIQEMDVPGRDKDV
jgi:serine/threonine protein phosphatase PrpC